MSNAQELNDQNIQETIASGITLVDFYADWCQPCKMLANTIDEVASDYDGKVTVAKVDIEACKEATKAYSISALPTVVIFKDGKIVETIVGLNQKDRYAKALDSVIDG